MEQLSLFPAALRVGRLGALRRAGLERGYRFQLPQPAQPTFRRPKHGYGGHPLVDDRYRRLPRR